jgi:hypothetical protein
VRCSDLVPYQIISVDESSSCKKNWYFIHSYLLRTVLLILPAQTAVNGGRWAMNLQFSNQLARWQGKHLARRVGCRPALARFGYVGVLCQPVKFLGNVYGFSNQL